MVKDEADVIERTLWNMAAQGCDAVVLLDNESTDGTSEILAALDGRVGRMQLEVFKDYEVGYYQAAKMTDLASYAGKSLGADWVWPFDADEIWTWPAGPVKEALAVTSGVVEAYLFNHYETALDLGGHPFDSMGWRAKDALGLPKVIVEWRPGVAILPGNHAASGHAPAGQPVGVIVHHFPYRGAEHFVRKAVNGGRAYAATDLGEDTGRHWRDYGRLVEEHGEDAARGFYREHFFYADPVASEMVYDPAGVPDSIPLFPEST
jgi:hypothetical protein